MKAIVKLFIHHGRFLYSAIYKLWNTFGTKANPTAILILCTLHYSNPTALEDMNQRIDLTFGALCSEFIKQNIQKRDKINGLFSLPSKNSKNLSELNLTQEFMLSNFHFSNPTALLPGQTLDKKPCMSSGGLPSFPFVVMGGFIPENSTGFPSDPEYANSSAVVLTFLINNYDAHSNDNMEILALNKAKAWESTFINFMKNWTSNENNTKHMDVAYNSERSIEDELDRETYGDIMTIAVSYIFMFIYITFSLGKISKLSRFAIESKITLGEWSFIVPDFLKITGQRIERDLTIWIWQLIL